MEWFLLSDRGDPFCHTEGGMVDIGGSMIDLRKGSCITVTFDEWFPQYLNLLVARAKSDIDRLTQKALDSLDLPKTYND
ncbi:hypothetical protein [Teredinibacter purpureus]|uniref:hypothetical protein n=1 Tax=Teredinibacter purpureus TaxID=2731756 RepID=UPI0013C4A10E|nr:hypothetical protein [Teredinibacter purpureus]